MRKHVILGVTSVVFAIGLVLWSQPTVPAAHTDLRPLSSPAALGARATDGVTINEIAERKRHGWLQLARWQDKKGPTRSTLIGGY